MTAKVLTVGPGHSLSDAARLMSERGVGAAAVLDPEAQGLAIVTERDILNALGGGQDPRAELVEGHLTADVICASPEWGMEQAAEAMVRGNFRHLLVLEDGELAGILSMRDIVRAWTGTEAQPQA